tara:strand:+ start:303 stop:707 length:405 start_codon:yes stop_codon:yes gene_type:complete
MSPKLVIDGRNAILGRLSSYVAKQALLGNEISILNCDEVIISGKPKSIIGEYKVKRERGGSALTGPFFPRATERIIKRTIRGMLPYRKERGATAMKNIKCYKGVPEEFKDSKKIVSGKEKNLRNISISKLAASI